MDVICIGDMYTHMYRLALSYSHFIGPCLFHDASTIFFHHFS